VHRAEPLMAAMTAITIAGTVGVGFYLRFLVALWNECGRRQLTTTSPVKLAVFPKSTGSRNLPLYPRELSLYSNVVTIREISSESYAGKKNTVMRFNGQ
jgi:hypothetical protein